MTDTVTIPRDLFDLLAALPQWPTEHPCPDCGGRVGHGYDCPAARPYWHARTALDRWRWEQEVERG